MYIPTKNELKIATIDVLKEKTQNVQQNILMIR